MTLITNTTNNPYYTANGKLTGTPPPVTTTDKTQEQKTATTKPSGDTVTLSKEVAEARTRESMGLNPTGRLKLNDFKAAAEKQGKIVESKVESLRKDLEIDKDQKISFSLNEKGEISINEKFPQKTKMENTLNEDKEFLLVFNRMSANHEVLDFSSSFQSEKTSLMDFMNDSDSDWSRLEALASEYSRIKSSDKSLSNLLGISREKAPYTFTHDPGEKVD